MGFFNDIGKKTSEATSTGCYRNQEEYTDDCLV